MKPVMNFTNNSAKEDSADAPPEQKKPQWFEKGVNAWDDDAVGYDKREDVPKPS